MTRNGQKTRAHQTRRIPGAGRIGDKDQTSLEEINYEKNIREKNETVGTDGKGNEKW